MSEASEIAPEIERKYLLKELPKDLWGCAEAKFKVQHGWLPGKIIHERITHSAKSGKFFRVIKSGSGLSRIEAQEEIDIDLFTKLWPLTTTRITKTRYHVSFSDFPSNRKLVWEVDDFSEFDPNIPPIAEIEVPSADYQVVLPFWLRNYVIKEVTDDPAYLNYNLARPV